jgi:hypothetical protein
MAKKQAAPAPVMGELFGLPGVTRWTEQLDLNDSATTVLAQANTVPLTGQTSFRQQDIVFGWQYLQNHVSSFTAGTDTVQTSKYFPYNLTQGFELNISNLYDLIDVQSGFDLAWFNCYRPMRGSARRGNNLLYTSPGAFPYNPQTNGVSGTFTIASTAMQIPFDVPACIWLDEYVDLDQEGNIKGTAYRVPVSPLYMSGTAREVMPRMTFASMAGANTDSAPFVVTTVGGGAHLTCTDTVTHRWQRLGMYGSRNPRELPQVFNWRYALASKRFNVGNVAQVDIPIKSLVPNGGGGQLLSIWFRFFDPAAGTGASGLPISINTTNFTKGKLLYGSSLIRFEDTPQMMQARVYNQHDLTMPEGIWMWDMALDDSDNNNRLTNARALNLYTTDVTAHFDFATTLSSSAYCVVGTEVLTYVVDQPVIR